MKTRAEVLHLRAFIEGLEVPVVSATVTFGIQASASAYIQIIGTDAALRIRPRSIVELYVLNTKESRSLQEVKKLPYYRYEGSDVVRGTVNAASAQEVGTYGPLQDQRISVTEAREALDYDLLFLGEVAGYSFYEDSNSRTINIICLDFSNHLDAITQYTYDVTSPETLAGTSRMSLLAGYSDSDIGRSARYNADQDIKYAEEKDAKGNQVTVDITGMDKDPKTYYLDSLVGGVIGLDQRIGKILGELGLTLGIKTIFSAVAKSYLFYKDVDGEFNLRDQIFIAEDSVTGNLFNQAQHISYIFGFQNRYGSLNSLKNLIKIVFKFTHFEFVPMPGSPMYMTKSFDAVLAASGSGTVSDTKINAETIKASAKSEREEISAVKQTLLKPELVFAEPPACNIIFPDEMYNISVGRQFLAEPTRGIDATDHVGASQEFGTAVGEITNLYSISPSVIVNSDGEVTSYAPKEMLDLANKVGDSLVAFGNVLLPEEVLKGIMPVHTFTSHMLRSAYFSRIQKAVDDPTSNYAFLKEEDITKFTEEERKQYEQISASDRRFYLLDAAYKFIYAKFQSRTATVSCKFLHRLVPGFNALACEKAPMASLNENSKYFGYIGNISQITHVLSQAGAVTSLTMTHVHPTNEYLDMFTPKGPVSFIPDYREIGTAPWASDVYGPKVIHKKFVEWLGGMTWRGDSVDSEDSARALGYYGVLPLTRAAARSGILQSEEMKKYVAAPTDVNIYKNFLNILRELMIAYQRDVLGYQDQSANVERFAQELTARPLANRLQVLGYLNAYFGEAADTSERPSTTTTQAAIKAYQRYLVATNYYAAAGVENDRSQVDGLVGGDTERAVREFQKEAGLAVTGALDAATTAAIDQRVTLSSAASEDKVQHVMDTYEGTDKIRRNRKFRRMIRLGAVQDYLDSLRSLGGGLRG